MKIFHYQIVRRKDGKVVVDNYGWADTFDQIKEANGHGNIFKVIEVK